MARRPAHPAVPQTGRLTCCILGCKRTGIPEDAEDTEWICAKHWPLAPRLQSRAYSRARRRWYKTPLELRTAMQHRALARLWRHLRKGISERAFGLR